MDLRFSLETVRFTISGGSDLALTSDKAVGGRNHSFTLGLCFGEERNSVCVLVSSLAVGVLGVKNGLLGCFVSCVFLEEVLFDELSNLNLGLLEEREILSDLGFHLSDLLLGGGNGFVSSLDVGQSGSFRLRSFLIFDANLGFGFLDLQLILMDDSFKNDLFSVVLSCIVVRNSLCS